MSLTAAQTLRRELDALDLEVRLRPPGEPQADLVQRARRLQDEARAVGLTVLAGAAALREGDIHLAAGAATRAIAALRTAIVTLTGTGSTDLVAGAMARLSDALVAADAPPEEVLAVCAQGIALVERDRYKTSAPYLQAGYLRRTISLYANGVRAATLLGDPRALAWVELSKSRVLPGVEGGGEPAAGVDAAELEARIAELGRRIDEFVARERETAPLRQERRVLFDRLVARRRRAAPLPDVDLDRMRATLGHDQRGLVYYWLDRSSLLIAVVGRDGVETHLQPVADEDRELLSGLARASHDAGAGPPTSGRVAAAVERLAGVLLPPAVTATIGDARRLVVSPHRTLHVVPFAALPVDGQPLVRRAALAHVPNLTSLLLPATAPARSGILAVGAAEYAVPGVEAVPLPQAEVEVKEVAEVYRAAGLPAETLVGEDVTEAALAERCSADAAPACLHLALHGASVESDTPLESWLLLPRSRLDGIDLVRWQLPGATVVLSACYAGQRAIAGRRLQELPGDDLFGLQTAFFAAGARQVLSALWPVESAVARVLTTAFHANLLTGATADVALQQATVDYLERGPLLYRGAQYWAPFFLSCMGQPGGLGTGP